LLYANQSVLDYTGLTMEEVISPEYRERVYHPEDVARLSEERQTALARGIVLDLKDVSLVSREVMGFLAGCEADGVKLENCTPYLREWMDREKD